MKRVTNKKEEWLLFGTSNPKKYGWEKIDDNKYLHRENKTLAMVEGREIVFKHITKNFSTHDTLSEAVKKYHEWMTRNSLYKDQIKPVEKTDVPEGDKDQIKPEENIENPKSEK